MANDNPNTYKSLNDDEIIHVVRDALKQRAHKESYKESVSRCFASYHAMLTRHDGVVMVRTKEQKSRADNALPRDMNFHDFGIASELGMAEIGAIVNEQLGLNMPYYQTPNIRISTFFREVRHCLIKVGRYDGKIPPPELNEIFSQPESFQANMGQYGDGEAPQGHVDQNLPTNQTSQAGNDEPSYPQQQQGIEGYVGGMVNQFKRPAAPAERPGPAAQRNADGLPPRK